ncbi:MAG TPA: carboxypeptidase-like regulatory domain-containing protein, partial [Gemmataceae bacterium]|nr:carboxypeptidase-like regulatory domain-containing protein [Gemmataceae bacterium]
EDLAKVRGKVLDPDGKPLAGAKLYLGQAGAKNVASTVRATSGDDGRFAFTLTRSEYDATQAGGPNYQVMAIAGGRGCDWVRVGAAKEELTLLLVKDMAVRGHILDPDGRPVAGARVSVIGVPTATGSGVRSRNPGREQQAPGPRRRLPGVSAPPVPEVGWLRGHRGWPSGRSRREQMQLRLTYLLSTHTFSVSLRGTTR